MLISYLSKQLICACITSIKIKVVTPLKEEVIYLYFGFAFLNEFGVSLLINSLFGFSSCFTFKHSKWNFYNRNAHLVLEIGVVFIYLAHFNYWEVLWFSKHFLGCKVFLEYNNMEKKQVLVWKHLIIERLHSISCNHEVFLSTSERRR